MNERIRELWSQAGGHYNSGNQHTWPEYTIDDPKKFAELIVRECAGICHKMAEDSDSYVVHDGDTCAEQIKKHFGVEE
jgi:hypothetical protein